MKNFLLKTGILVLVLVSFVQNGAICKQNEYSHSAIVIYNSGVSLQNQGKYEQAQEKYNQALKMQPDFVEAKKNLGILYYNLAIKKYSNENYTQAIEYSQKSLQFGQRQIDVYEIIARSYSEMNDFANAEVAYGKIIELSPSNNDSAMNSLAQIYLKTKDYEKAYVLYNKILKLNPNDKIAKQNLDYVSYYRDEKNLSLAINNIQSSQSAPKSLHRLIKRSSGISKDTTRKMENILDLIWSEPNGQILLKGLLSKKVHINITQGCLGANATKQQKQNTILLYGFIPIYSYKTSSIAVNIPFNYISDFYNPNLDARQRIYSLQVFVHEFGHAFINIKNPNHSNSIEEELGVSMIGYNCAYKIITGKYLTKDQTESYSNGTLQSLLSDEHRNLPVESGFNNEIKYYGINMPYVNVYSNLAQNYQKLLDEGNIKPVSNFRSYTH